MSEVFKTLETQQTGDGTFLALVLDHHLHAGVDGARLSWWDGSSGAVEGQITVLEAIERMTAYMLTPDGLGHEQIRDLTIEAAEVILRCTTTWLAAPVVSIYPDLGGAARPFWKQFVQACAQHPDAAANVLCEIERGFQARGKTAMD